MASSLLFIHGTGVRQAGLAATLGLLRRQAADLLPGWSIEACAWGDAFGTALARQGASLPGGRPTPGAADALAAQQRARWVLLADDPLIELRVAPQEATFGGPQGPQIWDSVLALHLPVPGSPWQAVLAEAGQADAWPGFIADIAADAQWQAVVQGLDLSAAAASPLVARALTAGFSDWLRAQGRAGLDARCRDALAAALEPPLGGPPAGLVDWMAGRLTRYARQRRGSLTDVTSPLIGDILRYQARGETVRRLIGEDVQRTGARVLLAHSLGGIAAVDWLAQAPRPIDALITVGSQAPYFYEIDALVSRAYGSGLPSHFPQRWLNIHDGNDLLGYPAADMFKGKVRDIALDSGEPFPDAHSAYFGLPAFWQAVSDFLKGH